MPKQTREIHLNKLLATLPEEVYQRLEPHLTVVDLPLGKTLYRQREPITKIYFPTTSLLSWVSLLQDGSLTEIALVGNTGVTGLPALWSDHNSSTPNSLIVQMSGKAIAIDAAPAKEEFHRGSAFSSIIFRYTEALFIQVAQNVACNRQHNTEERFARWLLSVQDGIQQEDVSQNELSLTQDFMAKMLGVRRSSISISAGILQRAGLIRYTRGRLTIVDKAMLESVACECYQVVRQEYSRLLAPEQSEGNS